MNIVRGTVRPSIPVLYPDKEDVRSNGLAWSNEYGIVLQSDKYTTTTKGDGSQWMGTQP